MFMWRIRSSSNKPNIFLLYNSKCHQNASSRTSFLWSVEKIHAKRKITITNAPALTNFATYLWIFSKTWYCDNIATNNTAPYLLCAYTHISQFCIAPVDNKPSCILRTELEFSVQCCTIFPELLTQHIHTYNTEYKNKILLIWNSLSYINIIFTFTITKTT